MTDIPAWLKSMEHGALGEARARAFLLQRFWVLSRSVDVEGADYLIQRRLTGTTFLDLEAPRLGVVQVKFIQDSGTAIKIPQSYVVDSAGKSYGEFFLLVCSGKEDDQQMFLLTAKDIATEFDRAILTKKDGSETPVFSIGGKALLALANFKVVQESLKLDKIEHALSRADLRDNRRFLYRSGYVKPEKDQIDHDYLLPLENGWGDIRSEFYENKMQLRSTMFQLEELLEAAGKIIVSTDPDDAIRIYEDDIAPHIGGGATYKTSLSVICEAFDDDDFQANVKLHKDRLAAIRSLGLEGAYFALIETYSAEVARQIAPLISAGVTVVKVKTTYDPETLTRPSIRVSLSTATTDRSLVLKSEKGRQTLAVNISSIVQACAGLSKEEAAVKVEKQAWQLRQPFVAALDEVYLGEDLVAC